MMSLATVGLKSVSIHSILLATWSILCRQDSFMANARGNKFSRNFACCCSSGVLSFQFLSLIFYRRSNAPQPGLSPATLNNSATLITPNSATSIT